MLNSLEKRLIFCILNYYTKHVVHIQTFYLNLNIPKNTHSTQNLFFYSAKFKHIMYTEIDKLGRERCEGQCEKGTKPYVLNLKNHDFFHLR